MFETYNANLRLNLGADVREFYNRMCAAQQEEALRALGKQYLDEFSKTNTIIPSYNVTLPNKPENYSKMYDAQAEAFKESSIHSEVEATERRKKRLLDMNGLCLKCGIDAKARNQLRLY